LSAIATVGIDHVGLAVKSLQQSLAFFVDCLGWTLRGERPDYPAAFVTDGQCLITLWQLKHAEPHVEFDRFKNIGLHHIAFRVSDEVQLARVFAAVTAWPGVIVEFAPQLSGSGPRRHFMISEPGGIRIEFSWTP
jgi:catechol 2,3-dioxygenase-like lactoylglutathione lyase family enzyme